MKEQKDKLDELITCRIVERQRKLRRMQEMSRNEKSSLWGRYTPLAIAACLIAVVLIGTKLSQNEGLNDISRAACPEVQQLIDEEEWEKAHVMVLSEIQDADSAIWYLEKEDTTDEEIAYELQAERQKIKDMKRLEKEILEKMK